MDYDPKSDALFTCFNQFFLIFVFWAVLFCAFVFSTLIGLIARATAQGRPNFDVDGQEVAIIVLYVPMYMLALYHSPSTLFLPPPHSGLASS